MRVFSHQCTSSTSNLLSCNYYSKPPMVQMKGEHFYDTVNDNFNFFETWAQVTATREADGTSILRLEKDHSSDEEDETAFDTLSSIPLIEKSTKKSMKHVPHRQKPPQLVAKRNLRERNRVQAVNTAFNRLRKAVPFQHARGKRISKVKTLQNAINYIKDLEELLQSEYFPPMAMMGYYDNKQDSMWWDLEY